MVLVYIDIIRDNNLPNDLDYLLRLQKENNHWNTTLTQFSPTGKARTMEINSSNQITNDPFMDLSLDLDKIGSPERYKTIFFSSDNPFDNSTMDFTNSINFPPPEFEMTSSTNPVEILP